ncbi:DUF6090 family protein [Flagellimonas zhangzhouensis]|uniref:Uncharacterized protein n=1 Tax=Flagellimonas zhangzhouensis TaxID=1073328 RepID=A0A1H2SEI5_9FLAO|nr:DUF6090 family protein [Allomuricauda zhangzhouensis]SDQ73960.1 hypothetical protein SAMN05216294_2417 [Allomuricauda zhangzhouensis]SDW30103.1 hypothetical protein SAMN04487892_1063 [Allomuricauda zhangzhouensis]
MKLFRKTRKKLVDTHRVKKYLLYAIGEIILVVIGILLALQINNWNENNKQQREVENALVEIKNDLLLDQKVLHDALNRKNEEYHKQQTVIDILDHKKAMVEDFDKLLGYLMLKHNVEFTKNGFDLLKDMGIGKIKDDGFRSKLTSYYDLSLPRIQAEIDDDTNEFQSIWLPYVREHFSDWLFEAYGTPKDMDSFLNDEFILISLKVNLGNADGTIEAMEKALLESQELVAIIDEKLPNQ